MPRLDRQVCNCLRKVGWTYDPATKWWVCPICRKPSKLNAIQECDGCGRKFIPATGDFDREFPDCGNCEEYLKLINSDLNDFEL